MTIQTATVQVVNGNATVIANSSRGLNAWLTERLPALVTNETAYTVQNGPGYTVPAGTLVGWFDEKGRFFNGPNHLANADGNGHSRCPDFYFDSEGLRLFTRSISCATVNDPCDINFRRWGGYAPYGGNGTVGTIDDLTGTSEGGAIIGQVRGTPAGVVFGGTGGVGGTAGATCSETGAVMSLETMDKARKVTDDSQASVPMAFSFNLADKNSHDFRRDTVRMNGYGVYMAVGPRACETGVTQNALLFLRAHEGTNAQQLITISGTPTGGTFKIKFYEPPTGDGFSVGYTTAAIAYNANAGAVQSALVAALQSIPGNIPDYTPVTAWSAITNADVTVTGGALPGTPITVEFTGVLATTVMFRMLMTDKAMTGGTNPNGSSSVISRVNQVGANDEKGMRLLYGKHTAGASVTTPGTGGEFFLFEQSDGTDVLRLDISNKLYLAGEMEIDGALNHDGTTVGFYGVTPVTRPTAYTQTYATATRTHANLTSADLTGISSSTTGSALAEPGAAYVQAEMQQNFRRIQDQYNALKADLTNLKQLVNSMIDDRQADGLAQ